LSIAKSSREFKWGEYIVIIKIPRRLVALALLLFMGITSITAAYAEPEGANYTVLYSETKTPTNGTPITAQGGNITHLSVITNSQTKTWQGFVGNITGNLTLSDASNNRLYSWNLTNISGQIYASRNGTINWNQISVQNDCSVDEDLTGKGSDRVSKTFDPSANNISYSVGNIQINASTTCAALPNVNDTKQKQLGTYLFENTILTRGTVPNGNQSIYVGILQANGVNGFDGQYYNFQLLVPVNKTSGFTTYYLYAELQ
jgi:hypothetical protein